MRKLVLFILTLYTLFALPICANELVKVSAVYEYVSDDANETPKQAEYKAIERAKLKALEEQFGVDISQINSTWVQNEQSQSANSTTQFMSLSGSQVRGVWIKTEKEEVLEKSYDRGFWYIKVLVKGIARPKKSATIQVETKILRNCTDNLCESTRFKNNDQIFLSFKSPVEGFVCVYLVDEEQMAYCLLPDNYNASGRQKVNANESYIFFSPNHTTNQVDEYILTTQKKIEQNALYIIFSPNDFVKANDSSEIVEVNGFKLPQYLSYSELLSWLSDNQLADEKMVVKKELISIEQ